MIGDGSFGNIFCFEHKDKKMAIKSIPYSFNNPSMKKN